MAFFEDMGLGELLKMLLPLLIIQFVLMIVALVTLVKSKKVRFLPKVAWAIIIIVMGTIGPIIFLIFGRDNKA